MIEKKEKIKAKLKNLDLEIGNLKIIGTKDVEKEGSSLLTGMDFDVWIDGKNFRDTPLKYLNSIDIHIGDAETIATVTYNCCPFVNEKKK